MDARTILLIVLAAVAVAFALFWAGRLRASARAERVRPTPYELLVGFITDSFDTLGIGSFVTTTSLYRARATIDDRLLPNAQRRAHDPDLRAGVHLHEEHRGRAAPAVIVAWYWFESLDINMLKWLVAVVVVYTAVTLLRAAAREGAQPPA